MMSLVDKKLSTDTEASEGVTELGSAERFKHFAPHLKPHERTLALAEAAITMQLAAFLQKNLELAQAPREQDNPPLEEQDISGEVQSMSLEANYEQKRLFVSGSEDGLYERATLESVAHISPRLVGFGTLGSMPKSCLEDEFLGCWEPLAELCFPDGINLVSKNPAIVLAAEYFGVRPTSLCSTIRRVYFNRTSCPEYDAEASLKKRVENVFGLFGCTQSSINTLLHLFRSATVYKFLPGPFAKGSTRDSLTWHCKKHEPLQVLSLDKFGKRGKPKLGPIRAWRDKKKFTPGTDWRLKFPPEVQKSFFELRTSYDGPKTHFLNFAYYDLRAKYPWYSVTHQRLRFLYNESIKEEKSYSLY